MGTQKSAHDVGFEFELVHRVGDVVVAQFDSPSAQVRYGDQDDRRGAASLPDERHVAACVAERAQLIVEQNGVETLAGQMVERLIETGGRDEIVVGSKFGNEVAIDQAVFAVVIIDQQDSHGAFSPFRRC